LWAFLPALFAQEAVAPPTSSAPPVHHHKAHKPTPPPVLPPLPSGPLHQLPMDQIPATPAKVSFEDGLLSISAQNSTLSEILRDVRRLTGAAIDIPPNANERVVTHLGPGAPRDVLAGLLNGTSFNYVMVGTNADPSAVASVVLMSKPNASGAAGASAGEETQVAASRYQNGAALPPTRIPVQQFNAQVIPQQRDPGANAANAAGSTDADDSKEDDSDNADDSAEDQAQPGQPVQPGQPAQPDGTAANGQDQPDSNQPNAGPKTPEQILEMLRRQQQTQGGLGNQPPQPPPQQPEQ